MFVALVGFLSQANDTVGEALVVAVVDKLLVAAGALAVVLIGHDQLQKRKARLEHRAEADRRRLDCIERIVRRASAVAFRINEAWRWQQSWHAFTSAQYKQRTTPNEDEQRLRLGAGWLESRLAVDEARRKLDVALQLMKHWLPNGAATVEEKGYALIRSAERFVEPSEYDEMPAHLATATDALKSLFTATASELANRA